MDWVTHKCDNAMLVKGVANAVATAFVPYHFEDTLDEKEFKRLQESLTEEQLFQAENQRFLVQTTAFDNTVTQHMLVGAPGGFRPMDPKLETVYRRGVVPDARLTDVPYAIELREKDGITVTLNGKIGADAIHKDQLAWVATPSNKVFKWFLDRRKESSSVVLFPQLAGIAPEDRAFKTKGSLTVTVTVNGNVVTQMADAPYTMRTRGYEWTRAMGKFLTPRLKALFPGRDAAIKDMKMLRAQLGSTSLVLIFNVPRMEQESMRLEGVVYTVSETNLLRAAKLPKGAAAAPSAIVVDNNNNVPALSGKPPPPPPLRTPTPKAVEPAVVAPLSPVPPEEDTPLPPPPDDDPIVNNNDSSSFSPEVKEGESPVVSPPASPPPPPPPAVGSVRSSGGGVISPGDLSGGARRLKFTPPSSPRSTTNETELSGSAALENAKRAAILNRRSSLAGEDGEDDWNTEAQVRRQILFSPAGIPVNVECDASNLAHITGLAMALEYRTAMGQLQTPDMEHVTSIIQAYARNYTQQQQEVPLDVSTAIYTALDTLNQQSY